MLQQNKKIRKIITYIVSALAVVCIVVVSIVFWVQFNTFTSNNEYMMYKQDDRKAQAMEDYFQKVDFLALPDKTKANVRIAVPANVIYDTVKELMMRVVSEEKGITKEQLFLHENNQYIGINHEFAGFIIPIRYQLKIQEEENKLIGKLKPDGVTEYTLYASEWLDRMFFHGILHKEYTVEVNLHKLEKEHYVLTNAEYREGSVVVEYDFDINVVTKIIEEKDKYIKQLLLDEYRKGNRQQQIVLYWLNIVHNDKEQFINEAIEDYIVGGNGLHELLMLLDKEIIERILEEYPELAMEITKEDIIDEQMHRENMVIQKYAKDILKVIDGYYGKKKFISNMTKPMFLDTFEILTFETVYDLYDKRIPKYLRENMQLHYKYETFYITARDESQYYVVTDEGLHRMKPSEYKKSFYEGVIYEGNFTTDKVMIEGVKKALEKYYGEPVYVRKMVDDGNQAFGVISPSSHYQHTRNVALGKDEKTGEYKVLGVDFKSIYEINEQLDIFNLHLAKNFIEYRQPIVMNHTTIEEVRRSLLQKGYIAEEEKIVFTSFDGNKYIFIRTSEEKDYIHSVYYGFLDEIFIYEEAVKEKADINSLITIQSGF